MPVVFKNLTVDIFALAFSRNVSQNVTPVTRWRIPFLYTISC